MYSCTVHRMCVPYFLSVYSKFAEIHRKYSTHILYYVQYVCAVYRICVIYILFLFTVCAYCDKKKIVHMFYYVQYVYAQIEVVYGQNI